MDWRPKGWELHNEVFEAGADLILDELKKVGAHCIAGQPITSRVVEGNLKITTEVNGWLCFIPEVD